MIGHEGADLVQQFALSRRMFEIHGVSPAR